MHKDAQVDCGHWGSNPEPFRLGVEHPNHESNDHRVLVTRVGGGTDHGRVSVAEGQDGVGEGRGEAVVYGSHGVQQTVHVGVGPSQARARAWAHRVAAQNVDGLLQAVVHFVLLQLSEIQKY